MKSAVSHEKKNLAHSALLCVSLESFVVGRKKDLLQLGWRWTSKEKTLVYLVKSNAQRAKVHQKCYNFEMTKRTTK